MSRCGLPYVLIKKRSAGVWKSFYYVILYLFYHFMMPSYKFVASVAYPGILLGGLTNSVEDRGQRERGSGDGSHLVGGSGGSSNLVQEISFHIIKFS